MNNAEEEEEEDEAARFHACRYIHVRARGRPVIIIDARVRADGWGARVPLLPPFTRNDRELTSSVINGLLHAADGRPSKRARVYICEKEEEAERG